MKTIDKIRRKFHEGCADYGLIADGDRILVALSGGKDSMLLTRLLAERARLYRPRFEVAAAHVVMDNIPYDADRTHLASFCAELGIPFHLLHSSFDTTSRSDRRQKTACFLCSWNRRKTLFRFAEEHGYNKLALGHHQDDILTTWLMNMTFEGSLDTMYPRVVMRHYPVTLIRPLCLVQESWIAELTTSTPHLFASTDGRVGQKTPCPHETVTRRSDLNRIFHELENLNPEARYSLWRAMVASHPGEFSG